MTRTILLLLGIGIAVGSGETLQVLVLEVEQRLVAPTYERAISKDPEALGEAIGKLEKLIPDKGVKEWLNLEINRDDPAKRIETGRFKYTPVPRSKSKNVQVGHEHRWTRSERYVSRDLKLSEIQDADHLQRFAFSFYHRLHAHWTLSAGVATPKGALFVFEKLSERDAKATNPQWLLSTLLDEKPGSSRKVSAFERFQKPPLGYTAIVRLPDSQSLASSASFDQAKNTTYSQGFSKSEVKFAASNQSSKPALKLEFPERSTVEMDIVVDQGPGRLTSHSGKFTLPMDQKPNFGSFKATHRDNKRDGNTTHSVASQRKHPEYFLQAYLIWPGDGT